VYIHRKPINPKRRVGKVKQIDNEATQEAHEPEKV